jgi:hypothetical protein
VRCVLSREHWRGLADHHTVALLRASGTPSGPATYTTGEDAAGREPWRTLVNAGVHCWKACKGQPFRSSNLLSSATLTCKNIGSRQPVLKPFMAVVSFGGLSFERWAVPSPG